ncbi:MAG: epoxyqueuosine reductase QueH, partial [Clostridiales bacterium]|nr:epoxyqueuosine reductase QueH [Candidatus Apopatousia equi]
STTSIKTLLDYFEISILYFNPNIPPKEEYNKRYNELKKFVELVKKENPNSKIEIIETRYEPQEYFDFVKGLENETEGGKRCEKCFELRLSETAKIAKQLKFDYFTTTLTVSPYKNSQIINKIGKELSEKFDIKYLFSDFKKNDGYKKSILYSKQYDLYRQDYCGCIYSVKERDEYLKNKNSD